VPSNQAAKHQALCTSTLQCLAAEVFQSAAVVVPVWCGLGDWVSCSSGCLNLDAAMHHPGSDAAVASCFDGTHPLTFHHRVHSWVHEALLGVEHLLRNVKDAASNMPPFTMTPKPTPHAMLNAAAYNLLPDTRRRGAPAVQRKGCRLSP
jgi:hypothetical protein